MTLSEATTLIYFLPGKETWISEINVSGIFLCVRDHVYVLLFDVDNLLISSPRIRLFNFFRELYAKLCNAKSCLIIVSNITM